MHTTQSIRDGINEFFNIDISSKKRDAKHFRARLIYYKLCFNLCYKPTYQSIGEAVNRDHSTVIYSIKTFDANIKFDPEFREMYESLKDTYDSFQVDEITVSDLMKSNHTQKKKIVELQNELLESKKPLRELSHYTEIDLLVELLDNMDDEQQYLLKCKLDALYKLNKNKVN